MARFLTGNELNAEVGNIIEKAEEQIILISPYIKLHDRFVSALRAKKNIDKLQITIVFGKNEKDLSKSMKQEDFSFFKEFPNIQIRYEKRLHAKYYANESVAILTSMNLYDFSQDNNIEAGVMTKASLLGNLASNIITNVTGSDSLDNQAWEYFQRVIDQSELLFLKTPQYEKTNLGLSKKYTDSVIVTDKLTDFFKDKVRSEGRSKETENNSSILAAGGMKIDSPLVGYCIRTGTPIPFNPGRPFCDDAYKSWAKFSKEDYPEKFCHFTGEPSNGETTKARPIMKKNWAVAKKTMSF